jgi:ubiquinone/menaquinone biosynthesis C-methylase UbiE
MRLGKQVDEIFRYYVLEILNEEGLFKYLKTPRTYGQILAEFGYVDNKYTRELLKVLASDKKSVLTQQDDTFAVASGFSIPELDEVIAKADKRIHNFHLMAKGMARYIPKRLRNQPVELRDSFEQDGRQLLTKFDKTLGTRIYSTIRNAAFAALPRADLEWLHGKSLLDVGCGSGRETAEIWLKMNGNIQITAIDPVASLLELAQQQFPLYLDELGPGHPVITSENQPAFKEASATRLPFPDNTFDSAFHSLVLHWTPDPETAISEIVRVVKPGGLIFGTQGTKPHLNPYFDMVIRISENSYGFFWREEFLRWYSIHGVDLQIATPVGIFYGRNKKPIPGAADSVPQEKEKASL